MKDKKVTDEKRRIEEKNKNKEEIIKNHYKKLSLIKSRVAKDNYIRRVIKKEGIYL